MATAQESFANWVLTEELEMDEPQESEANNDEVLSRLTRPVHEHDPYRRCR